MYPSAFTYMFTSNDDKQMGSSFIFVSEKNCLILRNFKGMSQGWGPDRCWVQDWNPSAGASPSGTFRGWSSEHLSAEMGQEWGAPVSPLKRVTPIQYLNQHLVGRAKGNHEKNELLGVGPLPQAHRHSSQLDQFWPLKAINTAVSSSSTLISIPMNRTVTFNFAFSRSTKWEQVHGQKTWAAVSLSWRCHFEK